MSELLIKKPIIIYGQTPSKKNSRKFFYVKSKKTGQIVPISSPSNLYEAWHKDALKQLGFVYAQYPKPITGGKLRLVFFLKDKRGRDLTNMAESVMDTLVDTGFLIDDNYAVISQLTLQFGAIDRENPRVEIHED